jgi:sporulation protein YlmC with PRC-barrel domain
MDLVREILDKQLIDEHDKNMGKVDGLVLELREGLPPRVAYIELGGVTLAKRLPRALERLVGALARRWSPKSGQPYRIPWSRVKEIGITMKVSEEADHSPALASERWVRDHIVGRIPGA